MSCGTQRRFRLPQNFFQEHVFGHELGQDRVLLAERRLEPGGVFLEGLLAPRVRLRALEDLCGPVDELLLPPEDLRRAAAELPADLRDLGLVDQDASQYGCDLLGLPLPALLSHLDHLLSLLILTGSCPFHAEPEHLTGTAAT